MGTGRKNRGSSESSKHTRRGEARHGLAKIGEKGQRANVGAPRAPVLANESGRRLGNENPQKNSMNCWIRHPCYCIRFRFKAGAHMHCSLWTRTQRAQRSFGRTLSSTLVGGKLAGVANGSAANLTESASARLFKKFRNTSWKSDEAMPASMRAATDGNQIKKICDSSGRAAARMTEMKQWAESHNRIPFLMRTHPTWRQDGKTASTQPRRTQCQQSNFESEADHCGRLWLPRPRFETASGAPAAQLRESQSILSLLHKTDKALFAIAIPHCNSWKDTCIYAIRSI